MDILSLSHRVLRALPAGNGDGPGTELPIKLIEAVVPGYSIFSNAILQYVGLDISWLVTMLVFGFIAKRVFSFFWTKARSSFMEYCMSCVHIDGNDDLYGMVNEWLAATRPDLSRRSLTARTQFGSIQHGDGDEEGGGGEDTNVLAEAAMDENGYFNFSKWAARVPPRYEPHYGGFWFTCRHGVFHFGKTEKVLRNSDGADSLERHITLRCIGLNVDPIKQLLVKEIKAWSVRKQSAKTAIRVANGEHRGWHSASLWNKTGERPSRALDTVILDSEQITSVQHDMNEFLHPNSPAWYASRGIPYRRGYLFHGPPGTGKTSLSFALAGRFGLDVHIINLNDPAMTESYLMRLFNALPKRCIVLLEDIDSAGIQRAESDEQSDTETKPRTRRKGRTASKKDRSEPAPQKVEQKTGQGSEHLKHSGAAPVNGNGTTKSPQPANKEATADDADAASSSDEEEDPTKIGVRELARAIVEASASSRNSFARELRRGRQTNPTDRISLSGLLNAIDGVATHEGRILVMTSNHPEKLDPALIRAGRVDMQIRFTNATELQIRQLFLRMYTGVEVMQGPPVEGARPGRKLEEKEEQDIRHEELVALATDFSEQLPGGRFAPSDVQGYLLMHRKKPRDAVAKVAEWRDKKIEELNEREEKGKGRAEEKTGSKGGRG